MDTSGTGISGKILIIDHSENRLSAVGVLLLSNGFDVVTTTNPEHGLDILDNTFDLVLLELTIPRMPGSKMVEKIRKNELLTNVQIMVVSMKRLDNAEIAGIFDLGIDDFMVQPVLEQELISRIKLHIKMRQLMEEYARVNAELKKELEWSQKIHDVMVRYASIIEDELSAKINALTARNNTKIASRIIVKLQGELARIRKDQEKLVVENKLYREELDKLNKIHSLVVLHDSAIEDEMTTRIDEESWKASHDHLTQIYNRVKFYEALYKEIDECRLNHHPLSVIMFDIDHFKKINDSFGHDAGDRVLLTVSRIVAQFLKENEIFARWGGEEFMILMPGKALADTREVAELLRKDIERAKYEHAGRITCSFGVAQFGYGDDAVNILKRVDNALFKAKKNGRNRVETV